jgi:ribonucleoside-diphosphate reductase alpha chain
LNGDNLQVNRHLQKDLQEIGLWNTETVDWIREKDGSIQGISKMVDLEDCESETKRAEILSRLQYLEKKHRRVFEYSQKVIINHAAIRGPYIDGSQSTNLYMDDPKIHQVSAALAYAHKKRNKTIIYYLKTKEARSAVKFTLRRNGGKLKIQNSSMVKRTESEDADAELLCRREADCVVCQ